MKMLLQRYRALDRLHKLAVWAVSGLILYTLIGFLVLPPIVRMLLVNKLTEQLHRPVALESLRLNPYTLSTTLNKFSIERKDGSAALFSFERLYINFEVLSLFKQALVIKSLAIDGPSFDLTRIEGEQFNFSDLLVGSDGAPATNDTGEEPRPLLFSLNNIEITQGRIRFVDQPKETTHLVSELTVAIPSVSNLPVDIQTNVEPRFSALVNDTRLDLTGGSKPFAESKATELVIKMAGIDIPEYLAYIPNPTGLILVSALLDLDTRLAYQLVDDGTSRLSLTGNIGLRDVEVIDRHGQSYLRLPAVVLVFADSNLLEREVRLAEVRIESPGVELVRTPGGELLPMALLPTSEDTAAAATSNTEEAAPGAPLNLKIDQLRLNGGSFTFDDRYLSEPSRLVIDNIDVAAEGLTTLPEQAGTFSVGMLFNRSGELQGSGNLTLSPLSLGAQVTLQKLALNSLRSYVAEQARVLIGGGEFSLNGELSYGENGAGTSVLDWRGDAGLVRLAALDARSGGELFKCRELALKGIHYASSPPALSLQEVAVRSPELRVLVLDDGRVNLATLAKKKDVPAENATPVDETANGETLSVTVNRVRLSQGVIRFQDRHIVPSYGFKVDQLNGEIRGLSSDMESRASVEVNARVDEQAPLLITGEVNPLSRETFADIGISFKDFNLPPLSPYSGKYAGYKTDKGKLQLDLSYRIEGRHLESSNKVFLDQFTLGEAVDSPDATSLPVSLAIALLKNRAGEIHLDIPVEGQLDDPEFSVAGVVLQVIVNLVTKAATSPFALLGALIPEGVDIEYIPFDAGSAELNDEALSKLEVVTNVLQDRPGVNMDLVGHVVPEQDREALMRAQLNQMLIFEKMRKVGAPPDGAAEVVVTPEEYPDYLERAYQKALKEAPRAVRKAQAKLETADAAAEKVKMESFLLGTITVGESDLRLLALERANRVLAYLGEAGEIDNERLFVVEPKLVAEGQDGQEQSAVQLVIR